MLSLNKDTLYLFAMCFLAFSFSFPKTLFPIGFLVFTVLGVFIRIKEKNTQYNKVLSLFYLLLFSYVAIRIIGNDDVRYGLRVLERNLPLLIIPLLLIPNKVIKVKCFYQGFVMGIVTAGVITVLGVGYEQISTIGEESRWYFTTIEDYGFHPTYMAMFALVALVMLSEKKIFSIRWLFIIGSFLILFILFCSSRIALITLLLLLLIKAITSGKKIFYYAIVAFGMLIGIVYIISEDFRFKLNQLKDFQSFSYYDNNNYGSVSVRVAKIKASVMLWEENKWFGVGTGDFREALVQKYRSKELECWPCARERYNSHNQYLNVLGAYGLVGFIIFGALVGYLFIIGWKTKNKLLLGILIVFLSFSLTESILEVQRGFVVVFFLLYYILIAGSKKLDSFTS